MTSVGECLQYSIGGKPHDGGIVVHVSQVAHVTFYITEHPSRKGWYKLFEASEKRGIRERWSEDDGVSVSNAYHSYEYATDALAKAQVELEEILERKRDGIPTQKQLHFLFLHKISIPIDLTWGQASDLIDDKLAQIARDKQTKRLERFGGFAEGDKVSFEWAEITEGVGYHKITKIGRITKLYQAGSAGKFAMIDVEKGHMYRVRKFNTMQKIDNKEQP